MASGCNSGSCEIQEQGNVRVALFAFASRDLRPLAQALSMRGWRGRGRFGPPTVADLAVPTCACDEPKLPLRRRATLRRVFDATEAFLRRQPRQRTALTNEQLKRHIGLRRRARVFLHVEAGVTDLQFSAPAQLDHFIEILSTKPLPTSRSLSSKRCLPVGPNAHWLSRLAASLKSSRARERLVDSLTTIRASIATSRDGSTFLVSVPR